jgi:hypothetical protein
MQPLTLATGAVRMVKLGGIEEEEEEEEEGLLWLYSTVLWVS